MQKGAADRSYGVQVARLAGLPGRAVKRAEQILKQLESKPGAVETLPLFAATSQAEPDTVEDSELTRLLDTVDPDGLTPREALDVIYRLKQARTAEG